MRQGLKEVPCCSPFVFEEGFMMQNCEFRIPSKTIKERMTIENKNEHFEVFNEVQNGELNYF